MGIGIINWLFALPAVYTIDTCGRRNLLLNSFPLMGICLLFTEFGFLIDSELAHLAALRQDGIEGVALYYNIRFSILMASP